MPRVTVSGKNHGVEFGHASTAEYKVPSLQGKRLEGAGVGSMKAESLPTSDVKEEDLSEEEWEELKRLFHDFDLDGNGYIDVEEFMSLCQKVGLSHERAMRLSILYDEDGDGVIDFVEFSKRDIVADLEQSVLEMGQANEEMENLTQGDLESNSHVNITKILQVARAKIDNSKIAFAFGRYMFFVIIYIFVMLWQRNPRDSMQLSAGLENYFLLSQYRTPQGTGLKTFRDIVSIEDFWDWHELHFVELFFVERYYNNAEKTSIDANTVLEHNKLTGGFRMTQRRIKNNTCTEYSKYKAFAPDCYGELLFQGRVPDSDVEKQPFKGAQTGTNYIWESKWPWNQGFYQEFAQDKAKAKQQLALLRRDMWIDKATQYYSLDFVVYNPNVGLFAFVSLSLDMKPTGRILPKFVVTTRRAGYYQAAEDWIRTACEILVVVGWFLYMYGELLDAVRLYKRQGRVLAYFSEFWNAVDIIHMLFILMLIVTWIYIITDKSVADIVVTETAVTMPNGSPLDFEETALAIRFYFALHGANMLIIMVRILKFLRMNAFLGQLTDAFELMRPGLLQFAVVLAIVIFLFTAQGVILFGSKIEEFSQFIDAIDMVMGYTVGYQDPMDLFAIDPISSIFFYYPFTFLMAFFVLPLTIAVIMDGYCDMQAMYEAARSKNLQLYRGLIRSLQYFIPNHDQHSRLMMPSKQEVLRLFADLSTYDVISFSELRKLVKNKFISEELLILVIKKYDAFQTDPEWLHLDDENAEEERQRTEEKETSEIMPLLEQLQLRADQLVRDQLSMQRKLDLLCQIFPSAEQANQDERENLEGIETGNPESIILYEDADDQNLNEASALLLR